MWVYIRPKLYRLIAIWMDYNKDFQTYEPHYYIWQAAFAFVLAIGVCVGTYLYFDAYYPIKQEWMDKIIEKCEPTKVQKANSWFYNGGILKICMFSALLGAYYGLAIDSYFLRGTKANINDTSFGISVARMIVVFILGAAFCVPYFFMNVLDHSLLYLCIF